MNKLIKSVLCLILMMGTAGIAFAQVRLRPVVREPLNRMNVANRPNPGKKIEVVKENYIGRRLNLSETESKAFWPVYRQYVQDLTTVRILKRQNNSSASPDGTEQIDKELKYDTEILNIRKHYKEEFLKILPPEKVSELYKSERQFNDEAVRILSERSIRAGN